MSGPVDKQKKKSGQAVVKKPAGSLEARRMVGVILEVMAGSMTPSDAAGAMSMSIQKYYMVESRALDGMLAACEPRKKGYVRTPEREIEALKNKQASLERECARYQALARAARRAVGLSVPKKKEAQGKEGKGKKGKRRRKPTVRALTLAKQLKQGRGESPAPEERKKEEQTGTEASSSQKAE